MSNTLNLGNGNWATKEDSLLAYNSENGNFKPLPFSFSRASSATVVNKAGLIETVGSGKARIDFNNDAKGALLLEPTRSNLIPYSEDFSNAVWEKNQLSIVANAIISPNGTLNASKLVEDSSNNFHRIIENVNTTIGTFSHSVFAKAGERKYFVLRNNISGSNLNACFDLENGVVVYNGFDEAKIENYGNGWYRCSIVEIDTSGGSTSFSLMTSNNEVTSNSIPSYQGDGTSGVYIWGAQLEQGSYATSYIPTQGSAVTRVADASSQTVPSGIIGQTEGTMFLDFNFDGDISGNRSVATISSGGSADFIASFIFNNLFYARIRANNGSLFDVTKSNLTSGNHKLAIAYASNDLSFYLDGLLVGQNTSASVSFSSALSKIIIGGSTSGTNELGGKIKETKIYNTRLSNAELQALTT